MALKPSSDVTFFPKLVELKGGESRNIRIGINAGGPRDVELSFRLFVEELPDQTAPLATAVALRTKVGIPVFVRPAKPVRTAVIDSVSVENGKVLSRVRNTGNLHISVDSISVKGTGGSAAPTFTKEGPGWYVLPGATRIFEVPMTSTECRATTQVAVEVIGHQRSLKGASRCRRLRALRPSSDCRCGAARCHDSHPGRRAGALDLGPHGQRRTEGRHRDRADG